MTLKVGDIVKCTCKDHREYNQLGFVEEIIRDPNPNNPSLFGRGKYSIYGFKPAFFSTMPRSEGDYYYGDHLESDLDITGNVVTVEDLNKLKSILHGGFKKDMDRVLKNLGRESGRNV